MAIQSYRDLQAWKLGMEYVLAVYALSEEFLPDERFGLTAQLRRAAVAIPSNRSEGHLQGLNYVTPEALSRADAIVGDRRRVLFGLRRSLRNRSADTCPAP